MESEQDKALRKLQRSLPLIADLPGSREKWPTIEDSGVTVSGNYGEAAGDALGGGALVG